MSSTAPLDNQYPLALNPSLAATSATLSPMGYILPSQPTSEPTSTWPKRASIACCNCRRDKIRCDNGRPCAACVKKGLADHGCIDGCLPCRRSRARCDDGKPCKPCAEMNLDCTDEPATSLRPEASVKPPANVTRAKPAERAKLACLACRNDNKKCDDNRPCARCLSRQAKCIHVDRGPKIKQSCLPCREHKKKCEDQRPCKSCVEGHKECIDVPRKGGGRGSRAKTACLNCRRSKVQCGEKRPCLVCVRRGLECVDPTCSCSEKGSGDCAFCRAQMSRGKSQLPNQAYDQRDANDVWNDSSDTPTSSTLSVPWQSSVEVTSRAPSYEPYFSQCHHSHQDTTNRPSAQSYTNNVSSIGFQNMSGMNFNEQGRMYTPSFGMDVDTPTSANARADEFPSQSNFVPAFPPLSNAAMQPSVGVRVGVGVYAPERCAGQSQVPFQRYAHRPAPMPMMAYAPQPHPYYIHQQYQQSQFDSEAQPLRSYVSRRIDQGHSSACASRKPDWV